MFKMYTMQVIELKIRDEDAVIIHIDGYGSYCISETFYKQLIGFYRIKQTDQVASSIMPVNSKYWVPSATICKIYPKHFQSVIKFLNNVEQIKAADGNGVYELGINGFIEQLKKDKEKMSKKSKEPSENEFTVIIKKKDGGRVTTEQAAEAFRQLGSNVRKMEKYQRVLRDAQDLVNSYHDGVPLKFLQTHLMNIEELGKEIGFNGSNDD